MLVPTAPAAGRMRQMVLEAPGKELRLQETHIPQPGTGELVLAVSACAICDIDAQIQAGDLQNQHFPLVPGHEIVGQVQAVGAGVAFTPGQRVGLAWQGGACGQCLYCQDSLEHLCDSARYTGRDLPGGYASHVLADARFCHDLSQVRVARNDFDANDGHGWSEEAAMAPLLCEGALAYRSYKACGKAQRIGLYGFGTAAQLICQMAKADDRKVYAMTRAGGEPLLEMARQLGADWTGTVDVEPPVLLDAAVLLQPTVELVPHAMVSVRKAGVLVFLGMHASRVPAFPYDLFLSEHSIHSISRSSRVNMREFLTLCSNLTLKTRIKTYPFTETNAAMRDQRSAHHGETVLVM